MSTIAPSLINEIGGDKFGSTLTAMQRTIWGTKLSNFKAQPKAFMDLGLLTGKYTENKAGGIRWDYGAIKDTALFNSDPLAWIENDYLPALVKKHVNINDPQSIMAWLTKTFPGIQAGGIAKILSDPQQRARIHKDASMIEQVVPLDKQYTNILKSVSIAMESLTNSLRNLGVAIFSGPNGSIADGIMSVSQGVNSLARAVVAHPTVGKILAGTALGLGALAAVSAANTFLGLGGIARALWNLGASLGSLAAFVLTNPLTAIAAGLAALGAAFVAANWDGIKAFFGGLADSLRDLAPGVGTLKDAAGATDSFSAALKALALGASADDWKKWGGEVGGVLKDVIDFLQKAVDLMNYLAGGGIVADIKTGAIVPKVLGGGTDPGAAARRALHDKLNPSGTPLEIQPGGIGYRAAGGPVDAGKLYLVGEAGPELLWTGASRGMVIPNSGISSLMGAGSFGGIGGSRGSWSGAVGPLASGPGGGYGSIDLADVVAYIRQSALARGIDPSVALAVAKSEGLAQYLGDHGTSFGPFQLHVGGGLGDLARRQGIDITNPATYRQQVDFALEQAKKGGWGPWHGAQRIGVANRQGLDYAPRVAAAAAPKVEAKTVNHSPTYNANVTVNGKHDAGAIREEVYSVFRRMEREQRGALSD